MLGEPARTNNLTPKQRLRKFKDSKFQDNEDIHEDIPGRISNCLENLRMKDKKKLINLCNKLAAAELANEKIMSNLEFAATKNSDLEKQLDAIKLEAMEINKKYIEVVAKSEAEKHLLKNLKEKEELFDNSTKQQKIIEEYYQNFNSELSKLTCLTQKLEELNKRNILSEKKCTNDNAEEKKCNSPSPSFENNINISRYSENFDISNTSHLNHSSFDFLKNENISNNLLKKIIEKQNLLYADEKEILCDNEKPSKMFLKNKVKKILEISKRHSMQNENGTLFANQKILQMEHADKDFATSTTSSFKSDKIKIKKKTKRSKNKNIQCNRSEKYDFNHEVEDKSKNVQIKQGYLSNKQNENCNDLYNSSKHLHKKTNYTDEHFQHNHSHQQNYKSKEIKLNSKLIPHFICHLCTSGQLSNIHCTGVTNVKCNSVDKIDRSLEPNTVLPPKPHPKNDSFKYVNHGVVNFDEFEKSDLNNSSNKYMNNTNNLINRNKVDQSYLFLNESSMVKSLPDIVKELDDIIVDSGYNDPSRIDNVNIDNDLLDVISSLNGSAGY
ncbi:hypothetical protein HDU92_006246 [Lobulomyces angularis]|nr:hypothetical protein HDU92_006246 [Lobulomyces angularis]